MARTNGSFSKLPFSHYEDWVGGGGVTPPLLRSLPSSLGALGGGEGGVHQKRGGEGGSKTRKFV